MPGSGPKYFPCIICNKRTKAKERRCLGNKRNRNILKQKFFIEAKESDVTCNKCRLHHFSKTYPTDKKTTDSCQPDLDPDYVPPQKKQKPFCSPQNISLPISSSGYSHSTCFICKRRGPKLIVVSQDITYKLFIEKALFLKSGSRCCPNHIKDDYFTQTSLDNINGNCHAVTKFNRTDVIDLIGTIREIAQRKEKSRMDFDDLQALNDGDYHTLTGITRANFDDLCSHISTVKSSQNRTSRTCLAILLVKLRIGVSNQLLATLFNISKTAVRSAIKSARTALSTYFTPKYIGFNHISRQSVIEQHTRPLAQELFGDLISKPAILVLDGTYIFIQKSNNFHFQRRSYSMHKHRCLVKPMMVVTTSGYIVSVLGPYLADSKNNDAGILKQMFQHNVEEIKQWLADDDVMIVDRGFRDSIKLMEDFGLRTEMPNFLPKGQKQHTTEEANTSRLITKVRWIVESVNGRIKQWKFLQNIVPNSQIPYIGEYVRLVSAICNKYRAPLNTGDAESDQLLGAKMKHLAKQKNTLIERIENENLARRTGDWKKMDADDAVPNFPTMTEEELRNITLGVYQLKMARGYAQEHLNEEGDYAIVVNVDVPNILRVAIQSRHTSSKKYMVWIEYGEVLVTAWYCQCRAGARVVGTCAHVSTVIWYLSHARHTGNLVGVRNWCSSLEDAAIPPVLIDSSDSEVEDGSTEE